MNVGRQASVMAGVLLPMASWATITKKSFSMASRTVDSTQPEAATPTVTIERTSRALSRFSNPVP